MVKSKQSKSTKTTVKKTAVESKAGVVKGSHLTVITDETGKTTLVWDDEALLRDVRNAILKHESTIMVASGSEPSKPKAVRSRKSKV